MVLTEVTLHIGYPWVAVAPGAGGASTVYAGGSARGVFKSSDGGLTWATANSGLIAPWINLLAIDPQNPHTVYTGDGAGLYESPDGATSWSAAPILPGVRVFALANDPQNPGTVYASTPNGLYKSIDGGESWVQLPVDPAGPFLPLVIDAQNPGVVYSGGFKPEFPFWPRRA